MTGLHRVPSVLLVPVGIGSILMTDLGFSAGDIRKIERGEVVAHSLPSDGSEVAIAAAAMLRIPIGFYLERFRAIESFKRSAEVLQVGRFASPPSLADIQPLKVDDDDIEALRKCRPGSCDVKLDDAGLARVAGHANPAAALRQHLFDYAARYLREGNSALMPYHDDRTPQPIGDELRQILARSPYLRREWPAVAEAVGAFRGSVAPGLQHFLYWSVEKPPGKPVISLTHAIIQAETGGTAVVATKQLYASHYMTGSLGLTVLVNQGTAAEPRTLLIYVNRTHVDLFDGVLGKLKRPIVRSRARGTAERTLGRLRERLEAEFQRR